MFVERIERMDSEERSGAYWTLVDSGEVVYVNEEGNQRWPEGPLYKALPPGVTIRDLRVAENKKLYAEDLAKVDSATTGAREEAQARGISLLDVEGTGSTGNITKEDVIAFAESTGEGLDEEEAKARADRLAAEEAEAIRKEQQELAGKEQAPADEESNLTDEEQEELDRQVETGENQNIDLDQDSDEEEEEPF